MLEVRLSNLLKKVVIQRTFDYKKIDVENKDAMIGPDKNQLYPNENIKTVC
jgi:hypothetical protein